MNDNFVLIDNIYRSRMNLLDILEDRGYNVDKYRKFSPAEATAAVTALPSLSFKVLKKEDDTKVCDVRYANITRQKLDKFFDDIEWEEWYNSAWDGEESWFDIGEENQEYSRTGGFEVRHSTDKGY